MSNVAFSMNTSIVGIIYSLGLTLLNLSSLLMPQDMGLLKKVESVIETLWFHLQTDQHKHNAEKILPKLLLTLEKILQTIETSKGLMKR